MKNFNISDKISIKVVKFFCVSLVIISIFVLGYGYYGTRVIQNQTLGNQGKNLAMTYDRELDIEAITLKILAANAQAIITGKQIPAESSAPEIVSAGNPGEYTLQTPPEKTGEPKGELVGLGQIPRHGTPLDEEMGMATSLSYAFEQVTENSDTIHRVYYTSINRFIYSYPAVPANFSFTDEIYNLEYFRKAAPENNPEKELVWSLPYLDPDGSGMIISISIPVYKNETFIGVLSMDTLISDLQWTLESGTPDDVTPYLVNSNGKLIASTMGNMLPQDFSGFLTGETVFADGKFIMSFPLSEVDWYVVFVLDQSALVLRTVNASVFSITVTLLLIFSSVIIWNTYKNMRTARSLAISDTLTGLLNRRGFDETNIRFMEKRDPRDAYLAAVMIDIDYFKKYNDQYGHMAGDTILRRVAYSLKNCLRSSADRVFRVGGEEFFLLFTIDSPDALPHILERLVVGVSGLGIPHEKSPLGYVTISAGGMVERLEALPSLEEAYRRSDDALYEAKGTGRNRWVIFEGKKPQLN